MFNDASSFNKLVKHFIIHRITDFIIHHITDFGFMFTYMASFDQALNVWNTKSANNMNSIFDQSRFHQLLSNWIVDKVISFAAMFKSSPFNYPLKGWSTATAMDMSWMFSNCPFNHPLDHFLVNKAQLFDAMFALLEFNSSLAGWDTWLAISMSLIDATIKCPIHHSIGCSFNHVTIVIIIGCIPNPSSTVSQG